LDAVKINNQKNLKMLPDIVFFSTELKIFFQIVYIRYLCRKNS